MKFERYSKRPLLLAVLCAVVLPLTAVSCSSTPEKLAPGHCVQNADCRGTTRCVEERCEDIYYPRREIKNY